jgi:hypothetical protein
MSRGYRDGGGSDAAVAVTSDATRVLRGYGYRHAVRDDAFYMPRVMLEPWAGSGPIEGHRGWLREDVGPSDPQDAEVTGTEPGRTPC